MGWPPGVILTPLPETIACVTHRLLTYGGLRATVRHTPFAPRAPDEQEVASRGQDKAQDPNGEHALEDRHIQCDMKGDQENSRRRTGEEEGPWPSVAAVGYYEPDEAQPRGHVKKRELHPRLIEHAEGRRRYGRQGRRKGADTASQHGRGRQDAPKTARHCQERPARTAFFVSHYSIHPLQGVRPELVSYSLLHAMALNDVARLDVIRENYRLFARGAARFLDFGHRPDAVPFARPERETRSVRAVEDVAALDPDRDLDLLPSPLAEDGRHNGPSVSAAAFDVRVPAVTGYTFPVHDLWHHMGQQMEP